MERVEGKAGVQLERHREISVRSIKPREKEKNSKEELPRVDRSRTLQ